MLRDSAGRLLSLCKDFSKRFVSKGMNGSGNAANYLGGLISTAKRKNMEAFSQSLPDCDYQRMEHFIGSSPWSHREALDKVAVQLDELIGGEAGSALYIDETSFPKKGESSVGVGRQYCGATGKIDNCQMGVFAALGNGERVGICDFRLYLPKAWIGSPKRMSKAGAPESERRYARKQDLALEMILQSRERGLRHAWVGFDAAYGADQRFCNRLDDLGETYVGDVTVSQRVWTVRPVFSFPKRAMGRPRKKPLLDSSCEGMRRSVGELVEERFERECETLVYRQGAKGKLRCRAWRLKVWTWDGGSDEPRQRVLILSDDAEGERKISLGNCICIEDTSRLAYMQRQRFWIEHAFGQAKSELGMGQYQVRKWQGWHHHMALVCMAYLFTLKEQLLMESEVPLLSVRDVTELLECYLPRKGRTEEEVFEAMKQRHKRRQKDIDRHRLQNPTS